MKRAGIYARYSPGAGRESTSTIEAQVSMCEELAEKEGCLVDSRFIYVDRGVSGATTDRPAFQQMMRDMEREDFPDIILCKDDKRLFRDELEAGRIIDQIWGRGIQIKYCLHSFGDPRESIEQWYIQRQFHLFAELERRRKAAETHAHQEQNAKAGFSNGGIPPYGYRKKVVGIIGEAGNRKQKVKWEIDPKEAKAVEIAFQMFLSGNGCKVIADYLTQLGYRSRKDSSMNKQTIAEWFRQPYVFTGCLVWNVRDKDKRKRPKSEWVIVPYAHQAIISMEQGDRAYEMMQRFKGRGKAPRRKKYLLSGLLNCSECNAAFIINSDHKRQQYYYTCGTRKRKCGDCSNRLWLDKNKVESQLMSHIRSEILEPDFLERYFQRMLEKSSQKVSQNQSEQNQLVKKKEKHESKIDHWLELLGEGRINQEKLLNKIAVAENELKIIDDSISKSTVETLQALPSFDQFRQKLGLALKENEEVRKTTLHALVQKIMVNVEGKLEVYFSVPCRDDGIHRHGGPNPGICCVLLYFNLAILSS